MNRLVLVPSLLRTDRASNIGPGVSDIYYCPVWYTQSFEHLYYWCTHFCQKLNALTTPCRARGVPAIVAEHTA